MPFLSLLFQMACTESSYTPLVPADPSKEEMSEQSQSAYDLWKSLYVSSSPCDEGASAVFVKESDPTKLTHSEAISYGLLAAVNANDQTTFDQLLLTYQLHTAQNTTSLMQWALTNDATCSPYKGDSGKNSATDGDMFAAYALLKASETWGGNYKKDALNIINDIKIFEMTGEPNPYPLLGSWVSMVDVSSDDYHRIRTSDLNPVIFNAFYEATHDDFWKKAEEASFDFLKRSQNLQTGLFPDQTLRLKPDAENEQGDFGYSALRVSFFLGWGSNDGRTRDLFLPLNTFIQNDTKWNPEEFNAERSLDGEVLGDYDSALFTGAYCAVAATQNDQDAQGHLDNCWKSFMHLAYPDDLAVSSESKYYTDTLSLLLLQSVTDQK